ncbi:MAG: transglutaminase-like domain-containing protein [Clostridium sp.]|nr:transglutaminase-like domain-containing protein [Clostridium sp.]
MEKERKIRSGKWLIFIILCVLCGNSARAEQITKPEQIYPHNVEKYNSERTDVSALSYYLLDRGAMPPTIDVAEFARDLVEDCADDMEKLQVIHDWIAGNIGYDFYGYYKGTYTIDPYLVFEKRATVCEGYALLTASMCHAVGIPCKVVSGYANGKYQSNGGWTEEIITEVTSGAGHAWNEAYVEGRWVILDTTWDSKVRNTVESEEFLHKNEYVQTYFDPSMEEFSKDHLTMDICDWEIASQYFAPVCVSVENGIKISWQRLESNTTYTLQYSSSPFDGYTDYGTTKETSIVFDKTLIPAETLYFRIYAADSTYYPDLYSEYSKWEKPQYEVTFMDGYTVISRQKVDCWQPAAAPDYGKEGYTLEWDGDYQCIYSDMTIRAKWTKTATDTELSESKDDKVYEEKEIDNNNKDKVAAPAQVKKLKLKNTKGRKAVIQWQKVRGAYGYQIQYSTSKTFKRAKSVYVKKNKYTAKKLKKKKTYYVRARAYKIQAGNKVYGKWSKAGKVKIRR